ncbi:MAG: UDP-3-O-(3-hydroxymyristoyl)glucosamine N-acyltransferase, partial [Rhodobacterales bacterium]
MKKITIEEIASTLNAEAFGDLSLIITGVHAPANATVDQLALAMDPSYAESLKLSDAQAGIVWPGADWKSMGLKAAIIAPRSRYILS